MTKILRDVEIAPPTFNTLQEALAYADRFSQPKIFIEEFANSLGRRVRLSADLRYDAWLSAAGSAVISAGHEAIKIGRAALIRDSKLFKTVVHEEMHLRLMRKARRGNHLALNLVTDPDLSVEEDHVEAVAIRYLRMHERTFGKFRH